MRLIDADALRKERVALTDGSTAILLKDLDAAPTVRCGDCEWCDVCDIHDQATPSDDFGCSYFERRTP